MTANELAADICVTAYGFKWGIDHDTLHDYIMDMFKRYHTDINDSLKPTENLEEYLN